MPLNPFFLQGSASEQRLVQDLVNEQLRMFGIEVYYLPREIKNRKEVFQEVQSSEFDDNFLIEAYVNCEQNSLLFMVRAQKSGICHTKNSSGESRDCYYRKINFENKTLTNLDP